MKNKMGTVLNSGKKKTVAFMMCGALVLTMAAGAVMAASNDEVEISAKIENGVKTYSTDDGATWSEQAPGNLVEQLNDDGTYTASVGNAPKVGAENWVHSEDDGTASYSTDGGKTWSKQPSEGLSTSGK